MTGRVIRVLVVDDDELTASAHAEYVRRVDGFEVAAVAHHLRGALAALSAGGIDLILLDMTLPDGHGIDLARRLRAAGHDVGIIAVTAVRDIEVVRNSLSLGIAQYVIKPFGFATLRDRLQAHLAHVEELAAAAPLSQSALDSMFSSSKSVSAPSLPKGLSETTLAAVALHLRDRGTAAAAIDVADQLSMSRVTARRYLEHLVDVGAAVKAPRYGSPGRPEIEYRWR